ncbi:hypothetical protein G6F37_006481 [Rhizopus arrhizus]|nr:hypothetical protein G6F38_008705 [Rhizopus arrhizus]KAG1157683.1 hypothetical protein G6F37_006481 [Rhizopus arrhizus]
MKFSEHLQKEIFPPWKLSYLSYDQLKKDLKSRQLDHPWNQQDEDLFIKTLENELDKVYDFITAKLGEVESQISYCERTIQSFSSNPTWSSDQNWILMEDALTELLFDINDLAKFTRLNYVGFQKILKKHDKHTGLDLQQAFVSRLRSRPLDKQRFDIAIVFISHLHDLCKRRGEPRERGSPFEETEELEEAARYWIHPDNMTEVKSLLMLHLPVLVENPDKRFEPSDAAVSSVYLDSQDFAVYTGLLQHDEGVEPIRLTTYGNQPTVHVQMGSSQHLELMPQDVYPFMTGQNSSSKQAEKIQSAIKGLEPVCRIFYHRAIFGDSQITLDSDIAFIREDNFFKSRRRGSGEWCRSDVGTNYPFSHLPETEVLRFPYGVLEVKTDETPDWLANLLKSHLVHEVPRFTKYLHGISYLFRDQLPLLPWWLSEMEIDIRKPPARFGLSRSKSFKPLVDGHYRRAMEAEQLRMSLVGTENDDKKKVILDRSKSINDWDRRPHRMQSTLVVKGDDPLNYGRPTVKQVKKEGEPLGEAVIFTKGDIRLDMNDKRLFESSGMYVKDPNDPNAVIPVKKVKVEPKVFFSNERTFIAWLQFCALLLSVALNLLNFGDQVSRIAGALFMGISAGIAIYALYQFERRAWMINRRIVGRYDDLWGPAVLCVLLVGALIVNFYLRFR